MTETVLIQEWCSLSSNGEQIELDETELCEESTVKPKKAKPEQASWSELSSKDFARRITRPR